VECNLTWFQDHFKIFLKVYVGNVNIKIVLYLYVYKNPKSIAIWICLFIVEMYINSGKVYNKYIWGLYTFEAVIKIKLIKRYINIKNVLYLIVSKNPKSIAILFGL